jgi:hypothetical protein
VRRLLCALTTCAAGGRGNADIATLRIARGGADLSTNGKLVELRIGPKRAATKRRPAA